MPVPAGRSSPRATGRCPSPGVTPNNTAQTAGMTRVEFLLSLNRYRVFPLASELEDLEETHAG